jgi:tetratricopeptide (TPR) repeat protein
VNLRESRVLITSRLDFSFTRDNRYQSTILPLTLRDLTRLEAFRLMENIPVLSGTTAAEKLLIYERAGGNPYVIDLVASAARTVPIGNVLADIEKIRKDFVETTLLAELYKWLPDDETRTFFRHASVYRKPVNQDFLVAMGGNDERMGYLLHKSMLNRIAENLYEMHTNTRAFVFDLLQHIDGASGVKDTHITAAQMYSHSGWEKGDVGDLLESRWFYFSAGEYDTAGELVQNLTETLHRWGLIELVRNLNKETSETATGTVKAAALHHLGMIHQDQGRYEEAVKLYEESLKLAKELGNKSGIAITLHQLGMIHQDQGRYEEAVKLYEESLKLAKELGNKSGIAITLHQLGNVHYAQGRYEEAVKLYEESLKLAKELGNKSGIAITLHQLGNVPYAQGRYEEAVKLYEESLKLEKELGNKSGIAITLGQLGRIFQAQGNCKEALRNYLIAFTIFHELDSPYKDLVGKLIIKLKAELGDEQFERYYEELTPNE